MKFGLQFQAVVRGGLCTVASVMFGSLACAQTIPAVHLINQSSQNAMTVLNSGAPFTTDFRGTDDVTITALTGQVHSLYTDHYSGSTPGNNPSYLTSFVGPSVTGTGDGTPGGFIGLESDLDTSNLSLQYDFAQPLTSRDRIVIADVERNEQYRVQAYHLVSGAYQPVSLTGWLHESFSGQTGIIPNASWAVWDPAAGTLTSPAHDPNATMNEPVDVLTPDQSVDRIVFTKLAGNGGSALIQIVEPSVADIALPSSFFAGGVPLSQGVYYLSFSNGKNFGYYEYLSDPHFIYHFDLGFEYVFNALDGANGVYFYDFKSNDYFYTSPTFSFPYLYDFNLQAFLYYYPDPTNPQRYNTNGVRYFYNFSTGQIISK